MPNSKNAKVLHAEDVNNQSVIIHARQLQKRMAKSIVVRRVKENPLRKKEEKRENRKQKNRIQKVSQV